MKPIRTWIVIADGAHARVFLNLGPGKGLEPVLERRSSASQEPTRNLVSDRPGRDHDRSGSGSHAMKPRADWHQLEKTRFAGDLAALLDDAARRKSFDRLCLVAPSKTLGDLRAAIGKQTAKLVSGALAKDLTQVPERALPDHLEDLVRL